MTMTKKKMLQSLDDVIDSVAVSKMMEELDHVIDQVKTSKVMAEIAGDEKYTHFLKCYPFPLGHFQDTIFLSLCI